MTKQNSRSNNLARRTVLKTTAAGTVGIALTSSVVSAKPGRNNNRRSEAELVELEPGDVVAQTSDPNQSNFEEAFTFWRVDHGIEYESSEYREPARTGPDVSQLGGSNVGAFWFGVSGPNSDGIQQNIDHKGQVALYMEESDTSEWMELKAQFNGQNELLHVNGVQPE